MNIKGLRDVHPLLKLGITLLEIDMSLFVKRCNMWYIKNITMSDNRIVSIFEYTSFV